MRDPLRAGALCVCRPAMALAVALAAVPRAEAASQNIVPNPSFESGAARLSGWSLAPGGSWSGTGRTGGRSLAGRGARPVRVALSEPFALDPDQSYRVCGWVRCRLGKGRLGMEVLDAPGAAVSRVATPWVTPGPAWQLTAVEHDMPPGAARARIWFEVDGDAHLDDVSVAPMKSNLVYNPSFEPDSRGRVGMWAEELLPIEPGRRAGALRSEATGRTGAALTLEPSTGGWFGARVVPAALPLGLRTLRFTGWSSAGGDAARVRVVWLDRDDRILRADLARASPVGGAWRRHECVVSAPAGATQVTVAALAVGGPARFDDFRLAPHSPARLVTPEVRVFVNQVGCERLGPKSCVVASSTFPSGSARGTLHVLDARGRRVMTVPVSASRIHNAESSDWGSYFWRGDFTALRRPGRYRVVARVGTATGKSFAFTVGDNALLKATAGLAVDFFYVQRCGFDVPGWHKACHMDDARLPDGAHIDATGGWHSAGDYNKLMYENGDGGAAYALLKAYDALPGAFTPRRRPGNIRPDVLDEALWGARFVAKMQNPVNGGLYKDIRQGPARTWMKWSAPEVHTDNIVGTDDDPVIDAGEGSSPLVPPAWIRMGRMLAGEGKADDLTARASRYWRYLVEKDPLGSSPLLLVCALDMHALTRDDACLAYARRTAITLLSQQVLRGRMRGAWGSSGELAAGALASYALARPHDLLASQIKRSLALFRAFMETTADNPFGLSKQSVGEKDYFFEPTSTMGTNFQQLQKAWACALIARLNRDRRALALAVDQVDWVLGKNPYDLCQMEGAGSRNPPRYHHRYDSIPGHERGAVPGAIPNGFVRTVAGEDRPGFDMSMPAPGKRAPSYRTSEPWLVHNMWYLMALSALNGADVTK